MSAPKKTIKEIFKSTSKDGKPYFLEPALGRVISKPSRDYMDVMSIKQIRDIVEYWNKMPPPLIQNDSKN